MEVKIYFNTFYIENPLFGKRLISEAQFHILKSKIKNYLNSVSGLQHLNEIRVIWIGHVYRLVLEVVVLYECRKDTVEGHLTRDATASFYIEFDSDDFFNK